MSWKWPGMLIALIIFTSAEGQERLSREQYIEQYADFAMGNMLQFGIPASITLAQGCLESDNGNSRLARKANNHFGIKCHDWKGKKIYHDDDKRNECFRKYNSPRHSFDDHSEFLTTTSRYAFLFDLDPDDYKGWARGLKKAGYATSNQYAGLLIKIIEDNELYKYDEMVLAGDFEPGEETGYGEDALAEESTARKPRLNNRVEYIVVEEGDTPSSLREEFDLYPFEIYRYNDMKRGARLEPGMVLYLQPKRFRAAKGNEIHVVEEGETMKDISGEYAVKITQLYKRNHLEEGDSLKPGMEIWLRRTRPQEASEKERPLKQMKEEEESEMEFRFDG